MNRISKIGVFILICFLLSGELRAQKFSGGLWVAAAYNSLNLSNDAQLHVNKEFIGHFGEAFGGFITFQGKSPFSAVLKYGVINKGFRVKANRSTSTYSVIYATFPLLLSFSLKKRFSLIMGPEFNLRTRVLHRTNGVKENIRILGSPFELAYSFGLNILVSKSLNLDLKYMLGLSRVGDSRNLGENGLPLEDAENRVLSMVLKIQLFKHSKATF